jgi:hypothetical protein
MLALVVPLSVLALSGPSANEISEATRDVLKDPTYQKEMKGGDLGETLSSDGKPGERLTQEDRPVDLNANPGLSALSEISGWILGALIIVVVVALVVWIVSAVRRSPSKRVDGESAHDQAVFVASSVEQEVLENAEKLAAEGRFSEAVHALLLRALQILKMNSHEQIPDFMTGRELLRTVQLSEARRSALGHLLLGSELAYFGGRPTERDDYERCVQHYQAFAGGAA